MGEWSPGEPNLIRSKKGTRMKRTTGNHPLAILTNDPSFTAWGWAVFTPNCRILETGCIKTEPKGKKLRVRKGDDRVRRTKEICMQLLAVIKKYDVQFMVSELPHGSQNASAAIMMGVVVGILEGISCTTGISLDWFSEGDAKMSVLGKRSAVKTEMITAIDKIYDVPWTGVGYKDEAVADSLAVFHVAQEQSSTFMLLHKNVFGIIFKIFHVQKV